MPADDDRKYCDLHMHSTASDGTTPPGELAASAAEAGLAAIALTDHDTTGGIAACAAACAQRGIAFAPGIELSADPDLAATGAAETDDNDSSDEESTPANAPRKGTLHLLGYFIDPANELLRQTEERLREARLQRNPRIIARLNELGVRITYDEVIAVANGRGSEILEPSSPTPIIGRPHIAQVMVAKGYAKSVQDAFARYIGEGKPAYVRKDLLSARQAIDALHQAGGLAVLAHPVQLLGSDDPAALEHYVVQLARMGLDGIETRHSDHHSADVERFEKLAARFNLRTTGGSDFHGVHKSIALGSQRVPLACFEVLRDRAHTR